MKIPKQVIKRMVEGAQKHVKMSHTASSPGAAKLLADLRWLDETREACMQADARLAARRDKRRNQHET